MPFAERQAIIDELEKIEKEKERAAKNGRR
jgi:hypothetical protein